VWGVERQRLEAFRRVAAQAQARLEAQPIETIGGNAYRQHPDDEDIVVSVQSGTALTRRRVEQIVEERAQQAARDQQRDELHAVTTPGPLAARIAELERQLAARGRTGK
jgi:hypothetical protein